jgi:hypothetical protein
VSEKGIGKGINAEKMWEKWMRGLIEISGEI